MVFDPTKAGKTYCACGNVADTFGGLCDRCASLQMLGLGPHAIPQEIEETYRTLVKVWHPDRFAHDPKLRRDAEEKLKEINSAHEYLLANPRIETSRSTRRPDRPPVQQETSAPSDSPDLDDAQAEEVKRILRRQQKRNVKFSAPVTLIKLGLLLAIVTVLGIIAFTADAFLSTNPTTMRSWIQLKTELGYDLRTKMPSLASSSQQKDDQPSPATSAPTAPASRAPEPAAPKSGVQRLSAAQHIQGAQPYVTAGLTPMEVLSALGKPTTSTGEKMFYGSSEIDFKNGQVAGWKIAPSSPIRVKLWPDSPPAPGLSMFAIGSSKSDVIAVQGTPTLFSDNEFGYGNSVVRFLNGRVISWKEDPASVRLRVPH